MKEEGKDPKLMNKEAAIQEQTDEMNKFYSFGTTFKELDYTHGAVKPLDQLAKSDQLDIE